jgi:hypothetical protein
MSYAAVFEVTRALRVLLRNQLRLHSASAIVTLLPPGDTLPDSLGVNLYLYRVLENPAFVNRNWPGDRQTAPSDRPALGLNLHYLITPLGTKPDNSSLDGDDAHTMLGEAMLTLQENPILNDIHLPTFDADQVLAPFLLNSYEPVKICLTPVGLDELSKIWSTMNKPYRLSVAYEVSVVELTPTTPPPVDGGIVIQTGVNVITLAPPRLMALLPPSGALAHISGGVLTPNPLHIQGFGFSFPGQTPFVRVGGQPVNILSVPTPTDQALSVALPTDLEAGPQADVRMTLNGRTSTPLPFLVDPWLSTITPVRTALDSVGQQVTLKGNGLLNRQLVRFEGPGGTTTSAAFVGAPDATQAAVTIPALAQNGLYNVRLVLIGSETTNARTLEVIPRLDDPIGLANVVLGSGATVSRLTLNGARLNGADVRLLINDVTYQAGSNANPNQLVYTLGRLLSTGSYPISLDVDGHTSHSVTLVVP